MASREVYGEVRGITIHLGPHLLPPGRAFRLRSKVAENTVF